MTSPNKRPEYITCITHTHERLKSKMWCGLLNDNTKFAFVNIDHACYNAMNLGRLVVCPNCLNAVMMTFKGHK